MSLPGDLHDEADGHAGILVRAAEGIHDEQALVGELLLGDILERRPRFLRGGMVVVLVFVGGPPHGVLGHVVHDDELVFRGAAGVDAGHHVDRAQLADLSLFKALQTRLGLLLEEHLVGRIVDDFRRSGNPILRKINLSHLDTTPFYKLSAMTESRIESLPIHKPYYPHDSTYIIPQRRKKINGFSPKISHA